MDLNKSHYNMIEQQLRPAEIDDPRVLDALEKIKRHEFLDLSLAGLAYADTELPIGYGQVMLTPLFYAKALQSLAINEQEDILHIGTGSGYFVALLTQLARHVHTVELIPELSQKAEKNLKRAGINNATCYTGDASLRWGMQSRMDAIVATAAFSSIPDEYPESLRVGGRLFAVVEEGKNMTANLLHRINERSWQTESLFATKIPAIMSSEQKSVFEF